MLEGFYTILFRENHYFMIISYYILKEYTCCQECKELLTKKMLILYVLY